MSRLLSISVFLGGLLLSSMAWSAEAPQELLDEARGLLQQDQPQQAFELLSGQSVQYAGDTEFDYWLGLSAVRAGEYGHASFALERVIERQPNHAGARLELATTYVALGQEEEAARQLDILRTLNPPPAAAKRIEQLSEAVARRTEREARQDQLFYVSLEGGHDDNAGTWPDTSLDVLPGNAAIRPVDSAFYGARLGGSKNFQVAPDQKVGVTGQLYGRRHEQEDAEQFDQNFGLLRLRWVRDLDGRQEIDLGAEAATLELDGEGYYDLAGAYATWRNRVSETVTYDATLRGRDIAFEVETNDYFFWHLGGSVQYQLTPRLRLDLGISAELEDAGEDRAGGDARIGGLDASARYALASRQVLTGEVQYSYAEYQDTYDAFVALNPQAEDRNDERYELALGHEWFFADDWQTRLEVRYREQDSSLDLFSYDRMLGTLTLTRYF